MVIAAATFSTSHIALTGALSGLLAGAVALWWLRDQRRILDAALIAVVVAAAVFLYRKSANMPALNDDGLSGFSANDWLAPTLSFVALGLYGAARRPLEERRFQQVRAMATLIALAVNVLTI